LKSGLRAAFLAQTRHIKQKETFCLSADLFFWQYRKTYLGLTQTPSNTTQSSLNVSFSSLRCKTKYRFQSKPLHQAKRGRTLCSKEFLSYFLLAQPRLPTRRKLEGRGRKVTQKRPHADQLQDGFSAQAIASRQPS